MIKPTGLLRDNAIYFLLFTVMKWYTVMLMALVTFQQLKISQKHITFKAMLPQDGKKTFPPHKL